MRAPSAESFRRAFERNLMGAFSGRRAIIAGATGAIGQVIADRLVAAGATVLLLARSRSALEQLVREREWDPEAVVCHAVDLSVEAEMRDFAAGVLRTVSPCTCSCTRPERSRWVPSTRARCRTSISIQGERPSPLSAHAGPSTAAHRGQRAGCLHQFQRGIHPRPGAAQYAATKYALRAIADTLREEVNERGVRVLSVYLGRVASEMQRAVYERERRTSTRRRNSCSQQK